MLFIFGELVRTRALEEFDMCGGELGGGLDAQTRGYATDVVGSNGEF